MALPDPDLQPEFYADVALKRGIAFILDLFVILALVIVTVVLTAFVGAFLLPLLFVGIGLAYRIVTLANRSATLGMRVMAIEFRRADGAPFGTNEAILHAVGFTICMILPLFQLISVVMMLTGRRGQGLVDAMLGTVALNRRAGV